MPAYQPVMMARLLLYGYCLGVVSSRKMPWAAHEDVAFRFLSADTHPDHDTIAAFRQRHLNALAGLFVQALRLCQKAGLVKLGHVAIGFGPGERDYVIPLPLQSLPADRYVADALRTTTPSET